MGLDNGIVLRVQKEVKVPFGTSDNFDQSTDYDAYEICYWRKCWGIRDAILKVLDPKGIKQKEMEGYYDVEAEDIPALIKAMKPFFSKEYWDEHAGSIWEFEEIFESQVRHIVDLQKLKEFLETHKDQVIKCYFYDSY